MLSIFSQIFTAVMLLIPFIAYLIVQRQTHSGWIRVINFTLVLTGLAVFILIVAGVVYLQLVAAENAC